MCALNTFLCSDARWSPSQVQRSDLFGAVVSEVPLLDMKRFHKLLAGSSWIAEYGDPDTDDWQYLQEYSPYHRVDRCAVSAKPTDLDPQTRTHNPTWIDCAPL